jgi:serine/threonine-protein kinase
MKVCPACHFCFNEEMLYCVRDGQPLESSWPPSRQIADKYQLNQVLARGGMGMVYQAWHQELARDVAIKILSPQLISKERMLQQFHREAVAIARLDHRNIVPIYDYGIFPDGGAYFVMRLVKGPSLREELQEQDYLSISRIIELMQQICAGVAAAHAQKIMHCDLKPDNILLEQRLGPDLVQIVDFGISQLYELNVDLYSDLDLEVGTIFTGNAIGTPHYMSPEQCCGETITPQSDIYSLGIMLFEMLTGRVPFRGVSATDVARQHVEARPLSPSQLKADIPPMMDKLVLQALSKNPQDRQQNVVQFWAQLWEASQLLDVSILPSLQLRHSDGAIANSRLNLLAEGTSLETWIESAEFRKRNSGHHLALFRQLTFPEITVLLVGSKLDFLIPILNEYECKVMMVNDGDWAWRMLGENTIHLVIAWEQLDKKNGRELFELAQQLSSSPVLVLVGQPETEASRLTLLNAGLEDYWQEPLFVPEVRAKLKKVLERLAKNLLRESTVNP